MKNDQYFIDNLFSLLISHEKVGNARVAACVVYKKKIISYGFNKRSSSYLQRKFKDRKDRVYIHAEIDAIKNSLKRISLEKLKRSTLYVARIKSSPQKTYSFGNSCPCKGCQRCIKAFDIKRVVYTK